jgi:hypothetical protein
MIDCSIDDDITEARRQTITIKIQQETEAIYQMNKNRSKKVVESLTSS